MEEPLQKLSRGAMICAILLTSCTRDDYMADHNARLENPLVVESREFFENAIAEGATKGVLDQSSGWNPGEYVPRWEEAWLKGQGSVDYVFVPITPEHRYLGRETVLNDSVEKHYHVPITQLLCFRKSETGSMDARVLTLVPSKGYYTANKNQVLDRFLRNEGFYGNFTGRVIYNDLVKFQLLAVDKVVDGGYEWGFSRGSVPSQESFWRNYRKMFRNVAIYRLSATKAFGDYDEESDTYDGGEIDGDPIYPDDDDWEFDWDDYFKDWDLDPDFGNGWNEPSGNQDSGSSGGGGQLIDVPGPTNPEGEGNIGGGGSNNDSFKYYFYTYDPNDKFSKFVIPIPTTFRVQTTENTCVPACLALANMLYGCDNTEEMYAAFIEKYLYVDFESDKGLHPEFAKIAINALMVTEPFTSLSDALGQGHCVFATIREEHCVLVVGQTQDDKYIYMDPEVGTLRATDEKYLGQGEIGYLIPVSGTQ